MPNRARPFAFTLNNYNDEHIELLSYFAESDVCRYMVYQREVGDSGTPHLQGYLELEKPKTLTACKTSIGISTIHLEFARNRVAARNYCFKEESRLPGTEPTEFGTFRDTGAGRRTDLDLVVEDIRNGGTIAEIAEDHPVQYIKYFSGITKLMAQIESRS